MKTNQIIFVLILVIVFSATSFFIGTKYQQKKSAQDFTNSIVGGNFQAMGRGMARNDINPDSVVKNRGQAAGFRQTAGEIISLDDQSFNVKLADGSSKIVLFSESTIINQSIKASKEDLTVGTKVMVNGEINTDGSITSRNIEIDPVFTTITPTNNQ
ncbi:MAG: DUF5666 domain-containing protein [Candidatus Shapirobacteria bacterium]|nr:DUF5666 domain-containing protein [Candidatus Shapirobacteria bacterium]